MPSIGVPGNPQPGVGPRQRLQDCTRLVGGTVVVDEHLIID